MPPNWILDLNYKTQKLIVDIETRLSLIKGIAEEIITEKELRQLLETNSRPVAYDGFEPSGLAHLPFGIYRSLLLKDLIKAGVRFKLWIADWFGWINNKMGGDLQAIQKVGEYFIEVWKAAGIDSSKVKFIWASESMDQEYWKKVILIAKNTSVKRATRALSIMGRKEGELLGVAQYYYPCMQTADIFHLECDMTQLGLDQRRSGVLARDIAPKLKWKKPVVVSHHMLMGLQGVKEPEGFAADRKKDIEISSKMSKSVPSTAIFVHDSRKEIQKKLNSAFCKPKEANNPVLDYCKEIVFRSFKEFKVERDKKFGGDLLFHNYQSLEDSFRKGELHPMDLKSATALSLDKVIKPVREHFEKNAKARKLFEFVKKQEATR